MTDHSRRRFLKQNALAGIGLALGLSGTGPGRTRAGDDQMPSTGESRYNDPIIDIHQHTSYHGRIHSDLISHQQAMGITTTILLPSGSSVNTYATNQGDANGLGVGAGGNEECYEITRQHPEQYLLGTNEVPDLPDAIPVMESWLKRGAKVIGEMKYGLDCDSPQMRRIYELARAYDVPVLLHWEHGTYNHGFDRFHKILEAYPDVNFIGHAQTWWANIDSDHDDQTNLYPEGPVSPGGRTDRLLADYPNMYGDLSAGSGLNALLRDEEHTIAFLERHQDKLLYGSDCADAVGHGSECQGAQTLETIRRLSANRTIERKLLCENARTLFRL